MMPGETGFELARFIRNSSAVPIVMLTARHEAREPHRGPADRRRRLCRQAVRAARTGAAHRQHPQARRAAAARGAIEQVAFGPYVFHLGRGELRQGDEVIHLTDREREMLRILAATPGETVPRGALTGNGSRQRARRRRADQPAAAQDRARSGQSRCSCRRCAASAIAWSPPHKPCRSPMSTLDTGLTADPLRGRPCLGGQWLAAATPSRAGCRPASMPARC